MQEDLVRERGDKMWGELLERFGVREFYFRIGVGSQSLQHVSVANIQTHAHISHTVPALVYVVDGQCAQTEDEEHGYEHVVDGPDVTDLKQITDVEGDAQNEIKKQYCIITRRTCTYVRICFKIE